MPPVEFFYKMGARYYSGIEMGLVQSLFSMFDLGLTFITERVLHVFFATKDKIYLLNIVPRFQINYTNNQNGSFLTLSTYSDTLSYPPIVELLQWTENGWEIDHIAVSYSPLIYEIESRIYKFARSLFQIYQSETMMQEMYPNNRISKRRIDSIYQWGARYQGYNDSALMCFLTKTNGSGTRLSFINLLLSECHAADATLSTVKVLMQAEGNEKPELIRSYRDTFERVSHTTGVFGLSEFTKRCNRYDNCFVLSHQELGLFLRHVKVDKRKLTPKKNIYVACLQDKFSYFQVGDLATMLIQEPLLRQKDFIIHESSKPDLGDWLFNVWKQDDVSEDAEEVIKEFCRVYKEDNYSRLSDSFLNATGLGHAFDVSSSVSIFHKQQQTFYLVNCIYLDIKHKSKTAEKILDIIEILIWHDNEWKLQEIIFVNLKLRIEFDYGLFRAIIMLQWMLEYYQNGIYNYHLKKHIINELQLLMQYVHIVNFQKEPRNQLELLLNLLIAKRGKDKSLLELFVDEMVFYKNKRKANISVLRVIRQDLLTLEKLYPDSARYYNNTLQQVFGS